MAALISATKSRKGGDGLRDKYNFNYVGNGSGLKADLRLTICLSLIKEPGTVW